MGAGDRTDAEADDAMDMSAKRRAEVDALWAKLNGGGGAPDASARPPAAAKARGRGGKKAAAPANDGDGDGDAAGPSKGKAALGVLARLNRVAGGGVAKKERQRGAIADRRARRRPTTPTGARLSASTATRTDPPRRFPRRPSRRPSRRLAAASACAPWSAPTAS